MISSTIIIYAAIKSIFNLSILMLEIIIKHCVSLPQKNHFIKYIMIYDSNDMVLSRYQNVIFLKTIYIQFYKVFKWKYVQKKCLNTIMGNLNWYCIKNVKFYYYNKNIFSIFFLNTKIGIFKYFFYNLNTYLYFVCLFLNI